MKHKKIAIIGAGIAGATLANRLLKAGFQVTIFEKSRGTGGRQSSCRIGKDSADLGAPWYEPKTTSFKKWLMDRPEITHWRTQEADFSGKILDPKSVFLASPRQSSLTQNLIKGAMLCTEAKVTSIAPGDFGLRLSKEIGDIKYLYDAVVVTTPAIQAVPLLAKSPGLSAIAKKTRATSNWVTVFSLKEKSNIDPDIISGEHPVLARAIRDSRKPGRNSWSHKEVWVLEANSEWSERYINSRPSTIARALIKTFESLVKQPINICSSRTHRWLYARHLPTTTANYLWDADLKIGVCADWLNNAGNEGAWLSANALADHLLYCSKPDDVYSIDQAVIS